jgi:hypothetical protein
LHNAGYSENTALFLRKLFEHMNGMQPDVLEKKVNIIVGRLLVMDGELLDTY